MGRDKSESSVNSAGDDKIADLSVQQSGLQSEKPFIQDLVSILSQKGLEHVVISPGSRHAPLSISFFHHPKIDCHVIPDERSAGYFALGIAQRTQKPVALVCTSGTALANYTSAVAEAFYQELPLIVLSADRPEEWVDQGDGQTIRQEGLLDNHIQGAYTLKQDDQQRDVKWHNQRMINDAWNNATTYPGGPVHINIPLREPLYGVVEKGSAKVKMIEVAEGVALLSAEDASQLKEQFASAPKVMILCGLQFPDNELEERIEAISKLANVTVLTETTSNMRKGEVVGCIDRLLMSLSQDEMADLMPDLLITFGSHIVSKKIKHFLRSAEDMEHWHIDPAGRTLDTFQHLTRVIKASSSQTIELLASASVVESDYHAIWYGEHLRLSKLEQEVSGVLGWSDLYAFREILPSLPKDSILQMGNSSVVRYIQLFDRREDIEYYGNRGTSGIDGCTSTAAGMTSVTDKTVTLISGDIAFLYDINGLWNDQKRDNLKIILINNGGGNIFKIIDGPSSSAALETVFETKHRRNAEHLAKHFGLNYLTANDAGELASSLKSLNEANQCTLLEVFTQDIANEQILKSSFREIRDRKHKH